MRWHGGKWMLAPWIIEHFPAHKTYVEPYGGGASVLLRKTRAHAEVYGDLNDDVVNLFRVLRDPEQALHLANLLHFTPFSRAEWEFCQDNTCADPVERARRLIARSRMGFGSSAHKAGTTTGFRGKSRELGAPPSADWANLPPHLLDVTDRFRGVVIESRPHSNSSATTTGTTPCSISIRRTCKRRAARRSTRTDGSTTATTTT